MGRILSKVGALEALRFVQLRKGKVYKNCEVIQLTDSSYLVKKPDGEFSIAGGRSTTNGKYAVLNYGVDDFTRTVLHGLVRIGAISDDDVVVHLRAVKKAKHEVDQRHAVELIRKACDELGVKVPARVEKIEAQLKAREQIHAEGQ